MNGYENLTDGQKQLCYEIIARLLGLEADVTLERITPRVAQKVDEFIKETTECSGQMKGFINEILKVLPNRKIADFAGSVASAIEKVSNWEGKAKRLSPAFAPCCFVTRRKYAEEVWGIFAGI
jgi:hypothetical protein